MRNHLRRHLWYPLMAAAVVITGVGPSSAIDGAGPTLGEPVSNGWNLQFDNDALALMRTADRNFTAGLTLTLAGTRARDYWLSLDHPLGWINTALGMPPSERWVRRHSVELGAAGFTPDDLAASAPVSDDHPYACLPFIANSRLDIAPEGNVAYQSTLLLGVLGTDLCEHIQREVHEVTGATRPRGWDNQISEGGEPTLRYSLTRLQPLFSEDVPNTELIWNLEASAGLTTGIGTGLSGRWGRLAKPWWSHTPAQTEYVSLSSSGSGHPRGTKEYFVWGGAMLRLRAYNALLQGQFRDSRVTFSRNELRALLGEAWLGATAAATARIHLSFVLRAQSPELRTGDQSVPVWGSIIVSVTP